MNFARGEMFRPYLVQRCVPSSLWQQRRPAWRTPGLPTGLPAKSQRAAHNTTVNALIVCSVQMIMCNVAALTFYATIYEDTCHVCNKSRKKKTACTWYCKALRVVCLFDCWEFFFFRHSLQSSGFIRSNLTRFFLYCMPL